MSEWLGYGMAALPGAIIGGLAGFPQIGAMASAMLFQGTISRNISVGVQWFHDLDRNVRRVNMGGDYQDTQVAWPMRQRAAQEMACCPHAREGEPLPSPI